MKTPQEYIANSDGYVAGLRAKKGDVVTLTARQAKYEDVTLKSDAGPDVEVVGSLDDPLLKSSGLAKKPRAARRGKAT